MEASGAEDGTDFRPFFDMVIGILFVLLILVAAQIYFQQAEDQHSASEPAKREAVQRRADIAAFVNAIADRLRAGGLEAEANADAGSVVLPLSAVLGTDAAGLPSIEAPATRTLGTVLAGLSTCVTLPRSVDPACLPFARLGLDALTMAVRVGTLSPRTTLARDRFGDFASALLSAKILSDQPALIGQSNETGGRIVSFRAAQTAAQDPKTAGPGLKGDLMLDFAFR